VGSAPAEARTPGALDAEAIRTAWPRVVDRLFGMKKATWSLVKEHAKVLDFDGRRLVLGISSLGLATTFRGGAHAEFVRQALIDELAVDAQVEAVHGDVPPGRQGAGPSRPGVAGRSAGTAGGRSGEPSGRPPSDRPGAASGGSAPAGRAADRPASRASERATDGPTGRPAQRADDGPTGRPAQRAADRDTGRADRRDDGRASVRDDRATRREPQRSSAPVEPPGWDDVPPPTEEPGDPEPGPDLPAGASGRDAGTTPGRGAGIASARERLAERGSGRSATPARVAPADDEPSVDDLDAADSGLVGRPVVERLLGGRVIDETDA
jgi:DNA polymerase-3 subunit gamma/tau